MKIQTPIDPFKLVESIRQKRDGQGGAAGQQYDAMFQGERGGREDKDQNSGQNPESGAESVSEREIAPAVMEFALKTFEDDANTKQSGLSASTEGAGPGLRVLLKDASGRVLRSLSGQEFLKLREGAALDNRARGKLLDKKF